jgi:hypothetical protein
MNYVYAIFFAGHGFNGHIKLIRKQPINSAKQLETIETLISDIVQSKIALTGWQLLRKTRANLLARQLSRQEIKEHDDDQEG